MRDSENVIAYNRGFSWSTVACKGAWLNGGGDCNAVAFQYIPLGSLLLDARK